MSDATDLSGRLLPSQKSYGLIVSDSASVIRYLGKIAKDAALPTKLAGDVRGDRSRLAVERVRNRALAF